MKNWKVKLATSTVSFILDGKFQAIEKLVNKANAFYITDENVYALHQNKFKGKKPLLFLQERSTNNKPLLTLLLKPYLT